MYKKSPLYFSDDLISIYCRGTTYVVVAQEKYSYHAILPHYKSLYLYFLFTLHKFSRVKIHKSTPLYIGFSANGVLNGVLWQGFSPRQDLFSTSKSSESSHLGFFRLSPTERHDLRHGFFGFLIAVVGVDVQGDTGIGMPHQILQAL